MVLTMPDKQYSPILLFFYYKLFSCFLKTTITTCLFLSHSPSHHCRFYTTMDIVSDIDSVSDSLSSEDEYDEMTPLWNNSTFYVFQ